MPRPIGAVDNNPRRHSERWRPPLDEVLYCEPHPNYASPHRCVVCVKLHCDYPNDCLYRHRAETAMQYHNRLRHS